MNYTKVSKVALFTSLVSVSKWYKISFILGSFTAFFSGINVILPLTGAFTGLGGSFFVGLMLFGFRVMSHGLSLPFHFAAYHLPGFFASAYWASSSLVVRFLVPLFCMVIFCLHPVGAAAWAYSLFWLIPLFIYFKKYDSIVAKSLGSTFVAHGVGSVIWLYTVPMTSGEWLSLIPVVCVERMVFVAGMVIMHAFISHGIVLFSSFSKKLLYRTV